MKLFRRSSTEAERAKVHAQDKLDEIRRERPKVMKLVRELRQELERNSFAERLEELWRYR